MKALMLTALAVVLAFPAAAAPQCAPTAVVTEAHRDRLKQTRQSIGLDGAGHIITLWAGPNGSWAITVTRPDGTSCLVGSGDHHTPLSEPAGEVM
jgi:hypothetical protein